MYMPTNTHILAAEFDYERPATLKDALALLGRHAGEARLVAGGTDLFVQMKMEQRSPTLVVSLASLSELRGISQTNGLTIGALTTIREIGASDIVRNQYAALREAAHSFSTVQIMSMGTLGGNLCNASPAADMAPALLAFDASVNLASSGGSRKVGLGDFFIGPGKTVLAKGEVMRSVELPQPEAGTASAFFKISRVVADISKISAAVRLVRSGNKVTGCRIALGAAAPVPQRIERAEQSLTGAAGSAEAFERAAAIAAEDISPISDVRASQSYRRHAARVIVRDALTAAWQRAAKGNGK
ncbi:MAG: xanthine dehydrogenase family protein subunit M [Hyphomicrobiaceae bacterium]|nr:MAG: xanthine dehydrogenase family protein subunit M [Hyphomicrobiaceae bacterium]